MHKDKYVDWSKCAEIMYHKDFRSRIRGCYVKCGNIYHYRSLLDSLSYWVNAVISGSIEFLNWSASSDKYYGSEIIEAVNYFYKMESCKISYLYYLSITEDSLNEDIEKYVNDYKKTYSGDCLNWFLTMSPGQHLYSMDIKTYFSNYDDIRTNESKAIIDIHDPIKRLYAIMNGGILDSHSQLIKRRTLILETMSILKLIGSLYLQEMTDTYNEYGLMFEQLTNITDFSSDKVIDINPEFEKTVQLLTDIKQYSIKDILQI